MKCQICQIKIEAGAKSVLWRLSRHLADHHPEITKQEYYDRFLKKDGDGICAVCGKPTKFDGLTGYRETCGHKCGGELHRKRLRDDEVKFQAFSEKVAENQTRIWSEREQTGKAVEIRTQIGSTIREQRAEMTFDKKKSKFGYLNKMDPITRLETIKKMTEAGFLAWWANATEAEKEIARQKRIRTLELRGKITPANMKSLRDQYGRRVRQLTEQTYRKFQNKINPKMLPRGRGKGKYVIDHIVSIHDGFRLNIPVDVIASARNLQMLSHSENSVKNYKSWMDPACLVMSNG